MPAEEAAQGPAGVESVEGLTLCADDLQCPHGTYCDDNFGVCSGPCGCGYDRDCEEGQVCRSTPSVCGVCLAPGDECVGRTGDCGPAGVCVVGLCFGLPCPE